MANAHAADWLHNGSGAACRTCGACAGLGHLMIAASVHVCIAGAVVSALGFFLSTFAPNVFVLMLLFGILAGTGLGLMYVPAVVAVGHYFDKRRALATGIAVCGSGAGTFVLAPLASFLLIKNTFFHAS